MFGKTKKKENVLNNTRSQDQPEDVLVSSGSAQKPFRMMRNLLKSSNNKSVRIATASSDTETAVEGRHDGTDTKAPVLAREGVMEGASWANRGRVEKADDITAGGIIFGLCGDKRQRKIVFTKFSEDPKQAIELQSGDIPEPTSPNHVVLKVTASTVSLFDCLIRKGVSYEMMDLPITPGMDVVGNIIKCGDTVKDFRVGDRVAALVRFGGNARYVNVLGANLMEVPRICDAAEVACLVSTYMTAYQAIKLVTKDNFSLDGKCVLITGGVDAVGQALVQLCQRAGASEIYVTAPTTRHKYIQGVLGVHPLSCEPQEWPQNVINGRMFAVFDGLCQAPYHALSKDGMLVSLGESTLMNQESTPGFFGAPVSAYWCRLKGNVMPNTKVYDLWDGFLEDRNTFKMDFEILLHLLKKRFIKPHIAKRISLEEVAESHSSLEMENPRGIIVCLPWKRSSATNEK